MKPYKRQNQILIGSICVQNCSPIILTIWQKLELILLGIIVSMASTHIIKHISEGQVRKMGNKNELRTNCMLDYQMYTLKYL